jgi:hypothetical protein
MIEEVYLGTYETTKLEGDLLDPFSRTGGLLARRGSYCIVLGDDYGDNACTLYPIKGKFRRNRKYRLVAVPVEDVDLLRRV